MSQPKAFICGCSGFALTADERAFLRQERPWGLILFKRNVSHPSQVRELVAQFRDLAGRTNAPVLVDQEGGRVQRLGPPHWPVYPAAAKIGGAGDPAAAEASGRLMAADLRNLGVSVNCMPVLDVANRDGHSIVGDRAYSDDPGIVAALGRTVAQAMLEGCVLPVVKHIPGHGRARADSHLELPIVTSDWRTLREVDFVPFRALASAPIAMTAHIVYLAIDPERPATHSAKLIDAAIRGEIGFSGLLLSDDLSMRALKGGFEERAAAAFGAGVDVVLHCNGDLAEAAAVARAAPRLDGASRERADRALGLLAREPVDFDPVDARARLKSLLAIQP